jgi:hypothetical protein
MTRDDIIAMAREAAAQHGHTIKETDEIVETLTSFYVLAVAAEREACIEACEASYHWPSGPEGWLKYAVEAIKSRGDK